jgi:peptidoglycan/LPS O-acetylase OafA/YrhL
MESSIQSKNLIGLDLLRFFLSFSILIVHFPFFSTPYNTIQSIEKLFLPFASFLKPIYQYGGLAVETFWMISGVIFFHFYLSEIHSKKISFKRFMGLRFSRLYPLHIVTLLSVAVLQHLYSSRFGTSFIYTNNDFFHFILNIFMINFWNAKFGLSFNGPFWSVSVEIFTYITFYLFTAIGLFKQKHNFIIVLFLCFCFYSLGILSPFYDCLFYFYLGCLVAQFFYQIQFRWLVFILIITIILFILKYQLLNYSGSYYLIRILNLLIKSGVFTILIISFGRIFSGVGVLGKRILREIGNMTYSIYMIHFSISLILILIFYHMGFDFFNNTYFFVIYLFSSCLIGYFIYKFFELPTQNWIRNKIKNI